MKLIAVILLIITAIWLVARHRRKIRARASRVFAAGGSPIVRRSARGPIDDISYYPVDADDQAIIKEPLTIPGRQMILRSAAFSLPALFLGVLLILLGLGIAGVVGLLAFGVLYPVIAAKRGWRMRARLARALAVVSTVVGLLCVLKLALVLLHAGPIVGIAFYLVYVVASVLLCVGVFRYSAAYAFATKHPRTGSRFSAETHRTVRVLGIAFAVGFGLYAFAAAIAALPIGELLNGIGASLAGPQSDPRASPEQDFQRYRSRE